MCSKVKDLLSPPVRAKIPSSEAAGGDPKAARERLLALHDLPVLDLTEEVGEFAVALVTSLDLPPSPHPMGRGPG